MKRKIFLVFFTMSLFQLHIFREGGHGFGMNKKGKPHDQWPQLLIAWMTAEKILK